MTRQLGTGTVDRGRERGKERKIERKGEDKKERMVDSDRGRNKRGRNR